MLSNERYIGDCHYQKTYRDTTVPFKQSKNRGEEDMYYATGTHASIIEKETFDKAQVLLQKRKEQFTKSITFNTYPLRATFDVPNAALSIVEKFGAEESNGSAPSMRKTQNHAIPTTTARNESMTVSYQW